MNVRYVIFEFFRLIIHFSVLDAGGAGGNGI